MQINLRNIFSRMQPTQQDIQTLHGVIMAIAEGRKGPARGGVLDGDGGGGAARADRRAGAGARAGERGPVRGLARLSAAQSDRRGARAVGRRSRRDRRFAGLGFKRQTPVGPHITDFVSFPLRLVIDIVPAEETEEAARRAPHKRGWLAGARLSRGGSRRRGDVGARSSRRSLDTHRARQFRRAELEAQPLALISAIAFSIRSSMARRRS